MSRPPSSQTTPQFHRVSDRDLTEIELHSVDSINDLHRTHPEHSHKGTHTHTHHVHTEHNHKDTHTHTYTLNTATKVNTHIYTVALLSHSHKETYTQSLFKHSHTLTHNQTTKTQPCWCTCVEHSTKICTQRHWRCWSQKSVHTDRTNTATQVQLHTHKNTSKYSETLILCFSWFQGWGLLVLLARRPWMGFLTYVTWKLSIKQAVQSAADGRAVYRIC